MQETGRYAVLLLSLLSFGLYAAYSALPMIAKEQTETVDACNCIFPRSYSLFYLTLLILESACRMMLLSISNDHQVNCVWNIKTPSFSGYILSFLLHICSSRDYTQDSVTIHNKVSESFIEGKENKKNKKQRQQHKEDNATTSSLTSLELPQPVLEEPIRSLVPAAVIEVLGVAVGVVTEIELLGPVHAPTFLQQPLEEIAPAAAPL